MLTDFEDERNYKFIDTDREDEFDPDLYYDHVGRDQEAIYHYCENVLNIKEDIE